MLHVPILRDHHLSGKFSATLSRNGTAVRTVAELNEQERGLEPTNLQRKRSQRITDSRLCTKCSGELPHHRAKGKNVAPGYSKIVFKKVQTNDSNQQGKPRWGQFHKTFTRVIYKCNYCSQTLKQWLHL